MMPELFDNEERYSRPIKEKRGRQMTARELVALQIVEAERERGVSVIELTDTMRLTRESIAKSTLQRLWLDGAVSRRMSLSGYRYYQLGKEPA